MEDKDSWNAFPQYRKWFNKLYVAETFKHYAGPCGTAPTISGKYVVRPIYNLSGMSVGAVCKQIAAHDTRATPPGYFWCQYFAGDHVSISYSKGKPISGWRGYKDHNMRFVKWERIYKYKPLPRPFREINVPVINVEYIGNKVIEIHLRDTPDPQYQQLIPVWEDSAFDVEQMKLEGYSFVRSFDDADGFLVPPRLGFLVKIGIA